MSFEEKVKSWVQTDNEIKTQYERLKQLREKKQEITDELFQHVERNQQLKQKPILISDGKISFSTVNVPPTLTFKYVEKCLGEIIQNKEQVDKIMDYLKTKREIKTVPEIKRYYNN